MALKFGLTVRGSETWSAGAQSPGRERRGAPSAAWRRWAPRVTFASAAVAALLAPRQGAAQRYVPTGDPEHPRLKYADSLESLNDRCIVRGNKLNPKMRPVYVNGQPIGFC